MKIILPLIASLIPFAAPAAELAHAERVEVKRGEPVRMEKYGGASNVALSVSRNDPDHFTIVQDSSDDEVRAFTSTRRGKIVPEAMAHPVTYRKINGLEVDRLTKAYLAYQETSGLKVYLCDGPDAGLDRFVLLIVRGQPGAATTAPASSTPPPPPMEPLRPSDLAAAERVQMKPGAPLDLRPYGGGNVAIFLQSNERDSFTLIKDTEHSRLKPGAHWEPAPVGVPDRYPKRYGIDLGGSTKAYVVHADPNGLRVCFCDTLDVSLNQYLFLIIRPHPAGRATPPAAPDPQPSAAAPAPPALRADPASPATPPSWSLIGGTLLYGGEELTRNIDADAARWGLPREVLVEERAWAAKQLKYGAGRESEYEQRQERRPPAVRTAVEQLRRATLSRRPE